MEDVTRADLSSRRETFVTLSTLVRLRYRDPGRAPAVVQEALERRRAVIVPTIVAFASAAAMASSRRPPSGCRASGRVVSAWRWSG